MKNTLSQILNRKQPTIMGIVNVTPDSFSDGGQYNTVQTAISHGQKLLSEGAHILDIGGESTRPNADIVSVEEEIRRVVPVIEGLKEEGTFISIDTRNSETMSKAIIAGANIVNDVSALEHDPKSVHVISESGVYICLMHMRGTPQNMQNNPEYMNVAGDVMNYFTDRIEFCLKNGISKEKIILDVGIGFGKTLEHNLLLLKNLHEFKRLGFPLLLGTSRKSFISTISNNEPADMRIGGSLASIIWGMQQGADIFRVHDVAQTVQAFKVYGAIQNS